MRNLIVLALLALVAPGLAAPSPRQAGAGAQPEKKTYAARSIVRRDLALPLFDGPEEPHLVFGPPEEIDTPPVVLAWWSLRDPLCRQAEPKLHAIAADYAARGVRVYLVASSHDELAAGIGDPLAKIRALREEEEHTLPLLLDRGNRVADEFGALCANQVFVIDAKRVVRYLGAIDDDPDGTRTGEITAYLRGALDLALEGQSPEHELRRAKGRKIKRAPVPEDAPAGGQAKKR